jgi:hypothetical protein
LQALTIETERTITHQNAPKRNHPSGLTNEEIAKGLESLAKMESLRGDKKQEVRSTEKAAGIIRGRCMLSFFPTVADTDQQVIIAVF